MSYQDKLNPPYLVTPEMGKIIAAMSNTPGSVIEIKKDNRYKDGNIKITGNKLRGNKNSVEIKRVEL